MHLIEIDRYSHINSLIKSWDERIKIISLSFFIITLSILTRKEMIVLGLSMAIILFILSRLPLKFLFQQLKWVLYFITFISLILMLTIPGKTLFKLGFISISYEGVVQGTFLFLKCLSIYIITVVMLGSSSFYRTLKALEKLRISQKLTQLLLFTYRYTFLVRDILHKMVRSLYTRNFNNKFNTYTLKTFSNLCGMLFILGLDRTERVYIAMLSRGYNGKITNFEKFYIGKSDWMKGSITVILSLLLLLGNLLLCKR